MCLYVSVDPQTVCSMHVLDPIENRLILHINVVEVCEISVVQD